MDTQYGTYAHLVQSYISANQSFLQTDLYDRRDMWNGNYIQVVYLIWPQKEVCLQAIKLPQCQNIGSCVGLYFKLSYESENISKFCIFSTSCLTYIIYIICLIYFAFCFCLLGFVRTWLVISKANLPEGGHLSITFHSLKTSSNVYSLEGFIYFRHEITD